MGEPSPELSHGPTVAQLFSGPLPAEPWRRGARLFGEAALYTGLGLFLGLGWGAASGGVLSIFLAAAGLLPRFHELLDENRRLIWDDATGGAAANWVTIRSLFAVFAGVFAAYLLIASLTGAERTVDLLGPALRLGRLEAAGAEPVTSFGALVGHRISILVAFFGVAFVYRSYAALTGLVWSGCVWGSAPVVAGGGAGAVALSAAVLVTPAVLDVGGIVLSSLAAIYMSKGLVKYRLTDPRALRVVTASMVLLGLGVGLCLAAGLVEWGLVRPFILSP